MIQFKNTNRFGNWKLKNMYFEWNSLPSSPESNKGCFSDVIITEPIFSNCHILPKPICSRYFDNEKPYLFLILKLRSNWFIWDERQSTTKNQEPQKLQIWTFIKKPSRKTDALNHVIQWQIKEIYQKSTFV